MAEPPREEAINPVTTYETIDEYQGNDYRNISEAEKNRLRMLEQQVLERKVAGEHLDGRDGLMNDPPYQYMSSASRGAAVPTRTQFTYHPYTTDHTTNMMMMQQRNSAPAGPMGSDGHVTLTNSPCPAAAGSSASPISHNHPNLYLPGPIASTVPSSHGIQPAIVMEMQIPQYTGSDEEEQEYTVMSQAGTLTGQCAMPYSPTAIDGPGNVEPVTVEDAAALAQLYSQVNKHDASKGNQYNVTITEC